VKKEIIVINDIEMGGGTITDDFISDKSLAKLILSLKKRKHPVDLVLNGDTFDFLKCPYIINGNKSYPRHITEEISLNKLNLAYRAHKKVFTALQSFLANKKHHVYFTIGNHDQDLHFKAVQNEIKILLKEKQRVYFGTAYDKHKTYIEHGQEYDINKIKTPFCMYKGKKILNMPWVSFSIINTLLKVKEEHPFLQRIQPVPLLFTYHKKIKRKIHFNSIKYFLYSIIYYPLRHYHDPTYHLPKNILREIIKQYRRGTWDIDDIISIYKKKRKQHLHKHKIHIFGHTHRTYIEEQKDFVIINSDAWRDEYILDEDRKLSAKKKYYIKIIHASKLSWSIEHYPISRKKLDFDTVVTDEKEFLKKVAKEEGYHFDH
jgi:UDP-2,3-diacylglucosamine pyrophosphatase LpxH